jgi:hypothetical protein
MVAMHRWYRPAQFIDRADGSLSQPTVRYVMAALIRATTYPYQGLQTWQA